LARRQLDSRLLAELAYRASSVPRLAIAVGGIDGAAGEDPDPGHELGLLAALQQQQLEGAFGVLAAAPQQDDRGGGPRRRRRPEVRHLRRSTPPLSHPPTLRGV